jgi:hypothetical protein
VWGSPQLHLFLNFSHFPLSLLPHLSFLHFSSQVIHSFSQHQASNPTAPYLGQCLPYLRFLPRAATRGAPPHPRLPFPSLLSIRSSENHLIFAEHTTV